VFALFYRCKTPMRIWRGANRRSPIPVYKRGLVGYLLRTVALPFYRLVVSSSLVWRAICSQITA
jgi:hypothetical protein